VAYDGVSGPVAGRRGAGCWNVITTLPFAIEGAARGQSCCVPARPGREVDPGGRGGGALCRCSSGGVMCCSPSPLQHCFPPASSALQLQHPPWGGCWPCVWQALSMLRLRSKAEAFAAPACRLCALSSPRRMRSAVRGAAGGHVAGVSSAL